jgi:multiple sugar transport system permease protein
MDIWQQVPFVFIIALAGLQSVPPELYESGRVDGANSWHMFWRLTVPLIGPIINIIILIRLMDAFRVFDRIWMLTKGGPGIATTVLTVYSYRQTFENFNVGAGSAISWIIFLFVAMISVVYAKISSRTQN